MRNVFQQPVFTRRVVNAPFDGVINDTVGVEALLIPPGNSFPGAEG